MSDINQEIDAIAEELEKSCKSPKDILFGILRQLGPDGIKAKLPILEKSEKKLLMDVLEDMKKAVPMDSTYAAKYVQGNIEDTKVQEDKADDDQDEKNVKPEAAAMAHQGTPTDGWEGQIIKGVDAGCGEKLEKELYDAGLYKDFNGMVRHLQSKEGGGHSKESATKIAGYINNKYVHHYAHGVRKAKDMSKEQAKDEIMAMEEKEHGTKDPKKLVAAEKKEHEKKDMEKAHVGFKAVEENARKHGAEDPAAVAAAVGIKKYGKAGMEAKAHAGKMKKGEECMDKEKLMNLKKKVKSGDKEKMKEGLREMKKALEFANPGADVELIKGEMKRLLAEESQDGDAPEMNEATRAKKEKVAALDLAADNKEAQKKVDDEKQGQAGSMKKSVVWTGPNDLLKAMTGGRNHHFSLEEYVEEVLKESAKGEPVQKSEPSKKEDLNDIIAKGGDRTWDHLNTDRLVKANKDKISGKVVKSFSDNEIAQALGLTEEEAKKLLGE